MNFEEWKKQFIDYFLDKIKKNDIKYEEFKKMQEIYKDLSFEIEKILEYASKNAHGEDKDKLWKLHEDYLLQNIGNMAEGLTKLGYKLRKDYNYEKVISALKDQSFRIMEKTRHTLRSEVEYMILRIFVINKKKVPSLLAKAFNPVYPEEIFKIFIYSFLCSILSEINEGGES